MKYYIYIKIFPTEKIQIFHPIDFNKNYLYNGINKLHHQKLILSTSTIDLLLYDHEIKVHKSLFLHIIENKLFHFLGKPFKWFCEEYDLKEYII